MPKVANAGKYHSNVRLIGRLDNLIVTHRSTGLDNRRDSSSGSRIDAVSEWEERIRGHYRTLYFQLLIGSLYSSDSGAVDAAHLAGTDANGLIVLAIHDGIGFYILGNPPGE